MKPVILIDVDGVLVQWQSNLPFFAAEHNIPTDHILKMVIDEKFRTMSELFGCDDELASKLMSRYNSSKWIRGLKAYKDALIAINALKYNYDFVAITALGTSEECCLNRIANLNTLFPSAFINVMTVGFNHSKIDRFKEAKEKYGDRLVCFIDDLPSHLEEASLILDIPMYHMIRGPRDKCRVQHEVLRDLRMLTHCTIFQNSSIRIKNGFSIHDTDKSRNYEKESVNSGSISLKELIEL